MTGFGVGGALLGTGGSSPGKLTIEIRAVNHRFLDVRVRAPSELPDVVTAVETLARERLSRGRFDITVRVDGSALGPMALDEDRARSVFAAIARIRDELAPGAPLPLSLLGAVPDLFVPSIEKEADVLMSALATAFDAALGSLDEMRCREGGALREELAGRLGSVRRLTGDIATRAPRLLDSYKKRLKERADRLRLAADVEIDPGRLEQELALFADRVDISEEIVRLESHATHFESLLATESAVGRRLDFLLQEMARESNTIGAKGQDVEIAHAVVDLKAEIERMREQVQNVE